MQQDKLFPATLMPDPDWWQALWPDPDAVVQQIGILPGMSVIDLGCGDGYFTAAISRRVGPEGMVIGLDLVDEMLEQAKSYCKGLDNCQWLQADAMQLQGLILEPVDYVLIANTFHGVPEKTELARAIRKELKPHGRFAIVNWYPLPRETTPVLGQPRGPRTELRMSLEQTQVLVEPAGFSLEAVIELPPYHYGAVFQSQSD